MRKLVAVMAVSMGSLAVACGGGAGETTSSSDQAMRCDTCESSSSSSGGDPGGGFVPVGANTHLGTCADDVSGATEGDFTAASPGNYWALNSSHPKVWAYEDYVSTTKGWVSGASQPYFIVANSGSTGNWYGFQVSSSTARAAAADKYGSPNFVYTYGRDAELQSHTVRSTVYDDYGVASTTYWLVHDPSCTNSNCAASHPPPST